MTRTLLLLTSFLALPAGAEDPAVLMRRSEKLHNLPFEHTRSKMVLQEKGGAPRERVVETWVDDRPSSGRVRVRFNAPADVSGTGVLSLEKPSADDEQWLYLPAFKKTRRLGSAELGDRFVGTDFFYEDMKSRSVDDYAYVQLADEVIEGQACHVIDATPRADEVVRESPYGKTTLWLRKDNLAVVRIRYFDRQLQPLKQFEARKLKAVSKTAWRADATSMLDVRRQHRTNVEVLERETNPLSDDQFSRRALESE